MPGSSANKKANRKKRILLLLLPLIAIVSLWIGIKVKAQVKNSIFLSHAFRRTIAFDTNPVTILSLTSEENEPNLLLTVAGNTYAKVPFGYGNYRLEAVPRLAELEKKPELFPKTVEDLFGFSVEGWVLSRGESNPKIETEEALISRLKELISPISPFTKGSKSSLNLLDYLLLSWSLYTMRLGDLNFYDLGSNPALFSETNLPDGSKIIVANESGLDYFIIQKFENSRVRKEALSIKILNATQIQGVGSRFARFLNSYGGKVVNIGNTENKVPVCEVKTAHSNKNASLISYLKNIFNCKISDSQGNLDSDVEILVGDYFAERWK